MSGRIRDERDGAVATLVIDHAERHNTLTAEMRTALADAMQRADSDDAIRVVVLTGDGEKAFASGGDIRELATRTLDEQRAVMANGSVFGAVRRVTKPVVAAVNGLCLGGGLELACSCDIRVAARHARFGQPEISIGLIPGGGGTQMLPRIVGAAHAMRLVLTGEIISADEALRIGLVHEVVEMAALRERVKALAAMLAERPPMAMRAAKEAVRAAFDLPFEEGRLREVALFEQCFASADRVEGVSAFLERRPAKFTGK